MATRLLVDGTFAVTITYYNMFPNEPKEQPGAEIAVMLPIDAADQLNPMTLLAVLTRILALPAAEKELLIVCHGTNDGLAMRLVPGSPAQASQTELNTLLMLGRAVAQIPGIKSLPPDRQPDNWRGLFKTLKQTDGSPMFPDVNPDDLRDPKLNTKDPAAVLADNKAVAAMYEQMFEYYLNSLAGQSAALPARVRPLVPSWVVPPLGQVTRAQLDDLIAKGNQVRGRLDRIDFRSCNTGKNKPAMAMIRAFFGCKQICAPNVVAFDGRFDVVVDPHFDEHFDNNVNIATRAAIGNGTAAGRQPVRLDDKNQQVPVAFNAIPKTRRFDAEKTRAGDEVFMRQWLVSVHPHVFFGWLRVLDKSFIDGFVKDKINPDVTRFTNKSTLPLVGLWLVDDLNVQMPSMGPPITLGPSNGDPLAGMDLGPPDATPLPAFALPRDPEYRQHLVVNP